MKILNVFTKIFMNTNTFEMHLNANTNTLHFLQKYLNTDTFKMYSNTYEYEYILARPGYVNI